jgi:3-hydroxyisobutyrate dehydrogenase-like beta-hydroxyacid dehydrogenase
MVIAVLGLGEAGSAIGLDLASAGVVVRGFDPAGGAGLDGVEATRSAAEAAQGADAVLSVNSAEAAAGGRPPPPPARSPPRSPGGFSSRT